MPNPNGVWRTLTGEPQPGLASVSPIPDNGGHVSPALCRSVDQNIQGWSNPLRLQASAWTTRSNSTHRRGRRGTATAAEGAEAEGERFTLFPSPFFLCALCGSFFLCALCGRNALAALNFANASRLGARRLSSRSRTSSHRILSRQPSASSSPLRESRPPASR